ncbi:cytochrome P450 6j1-like isoform X1 [Bacillus rossius redtenbacheri]|uniref:cytochrome P450 6j1-like isoform X1 n=1 Tax=Bacillus rossius redtenbacheri TaxID=93214 RepID=UPI002FDED07F
MALVFNSLLLDACFAALSLLAALYVYLSRNSGYWERRGVCCARPTPFLGSIPGVLLLRESVGCWLARRHRETAGESFFGAYFVDRPVLVVRDLELVKSVLVRDAHAFLDRTFAASEDLDPLMAKNLFGLKGNKWRHLRAKLSPTFTSGRMKKMFYLVDECGKQLASCLQQSASSGAPVDVRETMARYNTDVIASCAFGVKTEAQVDSKCEFRAVLKKTFDRNTFSLIFVVPVLVRIFRLKAVATDIENFVRRMFWDVVDQRRNNKELVRNDFMDLMIKIMDEGEVQSEDANDQEEINLDESYRSIESYKNDNTSFELKDDDFVAQAFVFLVAGFEGSSLTLTYALYELALNPGIQEKLRNEITTKLSTHGGKLSYHAMTGLPYLEMVVSETLRKYPPATFLDRECLSDFIIPGTQLTIETGTQIMIPVLGIHFDPEIYSEPQKFDPERFSDENKNKIPQYAYLPFGEGPRFCIGKRFALMQVKTALAYVVSSFQVCACAETPSPPLQYKPDAPTHSPTEDIVLVFRKLE